MAKRKDQAQEPKTADEAAAKSPPAPSGAPQPGAKARKRAGRLPKKNKQRMPRKLKKRLGKQAPPAE
ncbi:MAG: hypothetical protein KIT09_05700 [Bryobacteraceae bacterium]|nr:hypothetical protein [Bryobacteraceae bacterium]